jgi:hypothetical protein
MARSRTLVLSLVLVALPLQFAWGQHPAALEPIKAQPTVVSEATCIVYALTGLGNDANLTKWIAETIPTVIAPDTWAPMGGSGRVTYHAATKLMVVYQTPAVHAKVDAFLRDLRAAQAPQKLGPMMQAGYTEAVPLKAPNASASAGYLVPPPVHPPKHLFHLIVRYEGDNPIDSGVTDMIKDALFKGDTHGSIAAALGVPAGLSITGARKDDGEDKVQPSTPKVEPKAASSNQLFHIIVRYEGEGIVDSNVAALIKELVGAKSNAEPVRVGDYGTTPPFGPPAYSSATPSTIPPAPPSTGPLDVTPEQLTTPPTVVPEPPVVPLQPYSVIPIPPG